MHKIDSNRFLGWIWGIDGRLFGWLPCLRDLRMGRDDRVES